MSEATWICLCIFPLWLSHSTFPSWPYSRKFPQSRSLVLQNSTNDKSSHLNRYRRYTSCSCSQDYRQWLSQRIQSRQITLSYVNLQRSGMKFIETSRRKQDYIILVRLIENRMIKLENHKYHIAISMFSQKVVSSTSSSQNLPRYNLGHQVVNMWYLWTHSLYSS